MIVAAEQAVCLESLRKLLESAICISTAAEAGDWDAVLREVAENEARFLQLQASFSEAGFTFNAAERAVASQLVKDICEINDRVAQIITPRQQDIRQLLAALAR